MGIRIRLHHVFPDDPDRFQLAIQGRLKHLRDLISYMGGYGASVKFIVPLVDVWPGHIQVAGTLVGLHAHVGTALYVVLAPQGVYPHSFSSDVPRQHGQVGNLHNGEGPLGMLSDPKPVKGHRIGSVGIITCCCPDLFPRDPGNRL